MDKYSVAVLASNFSEENPEFAFLINNLNYNYALQKLIISESLQSVYRTLITTEMSSAKVGSGSLFKGDMNNAHKHMQISLTVYVHHYT